jgi:AcrR family transcriptional regulator
MSPRQTEANEELKAKQRERILNAAAPVFARHGFLGTKVTDIAAAAGVSHGLVHHYFGSKAEVFVAIIERTMSSADALPKLLLSMQGTYRERLAWFAQMILEGVKAMPEVFFLSIEAVANAAAPAEARRLVAEKGALSVQALGRFIAAGQAAGEFKRGDANTLAIHLFALVQGLAIQRLSAGASPPDEASPEVVVGLIAKQEES